MAQTYHVFDWRALGLPLAATLAAGLPHDARTKRGAGDIPLDTLLLAAAADRLGLLVWSKTRQAQKGRGRPPEILRLLLDGEDKNKGYSTPADYEAAKADILRRCGHGE